MIIPPRSARSVGGRVIFPPVLTLIAALTCFGGSLGAVLDPTPASMGAVVTGEMEPIVGSGRMESILAVATTGTVSTWIDPATANEIDPDAGAPGQDRADDDAAVGGADAFGSDKTAAETKGQAEERILTVGRGDTLSGLLARGGVAPSDRHAAIEALRPLLIRARCARRDGRHRHGRRPG